MPVAAGLAACAPPLASPRRRPALRRPHPPRPGPVQWCRRPGEA